MHPRSRLPLARWTFFAFCLLLTVASVHGQQQEVQRPYKPQVGQAGKDVIWVPTPYELVARMLDMAKVTPQDYVVDLGSGDGRTVIAAAKRGARALGIEYNPEMVELSRKNAAAAGVADRAKFVQADLFKTDLSQATVITMFLLPSINLKLRPELLDLRPGTRIVSNSFSMEDWHADETQSITGNCQSWCTALLWVVPAKVEGTWKTPQGALTISQKFQYFSGTLGSESITNGHLRGDAIEFAVGTTHYSGRVDGNSMTVTGGPNGPWTATRQ